MQLRLVWAGMTEQQVGRALGEPWWTAQVYENSAYWVSVMNGTVQTVTSKSQPEITVLYGKKNTEDSVFIDGKKYPSDGPIAAARFSWPFHSGMTSAEIGAIMGAPTEDCRDYRGDARLTPKICFKNGRVVSKRLVDQPPT